MFKIQENMKPINNASQIKNKSIAFVILDQFGYSAGYYYYCKYLLKFGYQVSVICIDRNLPKISIEGNFIVHYIRLSYFNSIISRCKIIKFLLKNKYDIYILKYSIGISLASFFTNSNKTFLDIRTGSVSKNNVKRYINNLLLRIESFFFNKILILSEELAIKLKLPNEKINYLPLGADEISMINKDYCSSMNLLYIGTFYGRNIHQCINGLNKFYAEYKNDISITFDIIGSGGANDEEKINNCIKNNGLSHIVFLHGEMNHIDAKKYFEKCNYGISYIPITNYYNLQPPTKTLEYIISGLVCIGTQTKANAKLISNVNGILHKDNAEDFYQALVKIYNMRKNYCTSKVKESLNEYLWKNVVKHFLIPVLNKISI